MAAARAHRGAPGGPGPAGDLGGILAGTLPAMDQDDEPGARTPPLAGASSRKGVLRRLLDGLRGETPAPGAAGDPRRLGRYRILHRLGQGGMGVVFAAEDESLGRRVAVKTIAEPDDSARKRFRREARAAAGVNHPNVCQVYEIGEDGGQLFIAMELLEGESLADRLRRGPLPVEEAVALGRGMLAALSALHTSGRRPSRPQALERLPDPARRQAPRLRPGAAPAEGAHAVARDRHRAHAPRPALGTPRYMAPEQVLGHEVDARTDLFSAAAILYEAVSGRPAFLRHDRRRGPLGHRPRAAAGARGRRGGRGLRPGAPASAGQAPGRPPRVGRGDGGGAGAGRDRGDLHGHVRGAAADPPGRPPVSPAAARPRDRLPLLRAGRRGLGVARRAAVGRHPVERRGRALRHRVAGPQGPGGPGRRRPGADGHPPPRGRAAARDGPARGGARRDPRVLPDAAGARSATSSACRTSSRSGSSSRSRCRSPSARGRRRGVPASARAYEFYLRANEVVRDWSHVAVARDLYRQCVDEDPSFAPGWASLGRCHRLLAKYFLDRPEENLARADEAYRRALELDPDAAGGPQALRAPRGRRWAAPATPWCDCSGSRARPATTPRSSPASSTPAATAASWRPPRRLTARRGGSTRTSRRASSTRGGPGGTWRGSSRRRRTPGTPSCGRWRLEALGRQDEARKSLQRDPGLGPRPGAGRRSRGP